MSMFTLSLSTYILCTSSHGLVKPIFVYIYMEKRTSRSAQNDQLIVYMSTHDTASDSSMMSVVSVIKISERKGERTIVVIQDLQRNRARGLGHKSTW